ncbi:MAG: hypothetical protein ACJ8C4_00525 [Gemmataceae bacterium]
MNWANGTYVGDDKITYYGCVLCQREHREGIDAEYKPHLWKQSKHGVRVRGPLNLGEKFAAYFIAEGGDVAAQVDPLELATI